MDLIGLLTKAVPGMPSWAWRWIGIALLLASCVGYGMWKMHEWDRAEIELKESELQTFKAQAAALGKAAQAAADRQKAEDEARQKGANDENRIAHDRLSADNDRLRKQLASSNTVPPAPAGSGRPDLACFDRTELDAAFGGLLGDLQDQAQSGSASTVDLNTAKRWAQKPK